LLNSEQNITDMTNFLLSLTDERVRYQRAPFDHPQLMLIDGQAGDEWQVAAGNPLDANLAKDRQLTIPAVGAGGLDTPLPAFLSAPP